MAEPKRGGSYARRTYDPEIHCGAPMDRSLSYLTEGRASVDAKITELEALKAERELTILEKTRLKRKNRSRQFFDIEIGKIEKYGPDDRPCMNRKGFKTTHPGTGLCRKHCECKGRLNYHIGGKFSYGRRAKSPKLREIMDSMEAANMDLLDLTPELHLFKATIQLWVQEKEDALSLTPEEIKSLAVLQEQIRKTVETVNNKKFQSMMTVELFRYINYRMGEVVADEVKDPELLDRIMSRWEKIAVEESSKKSGKALLGVSTGGSGE